MKKICLVIGHSASDGGAHNSTLNLSEYDYNQKFASLLAERLHKLDVLPVIIYRHTYSGMIADVNATKADFAIELHCNAVSNADIQGAETLYWHKSKASKALAKVIQGVTCHLLNENNRGIKPIDSTGRGGQFLSDTSMPAVIVEPFFLSNTNSLHLALTLREQLAQELAIAIANHVNQGVSHETT